MYKIILLHGALGSKEDLTPLASNLQTAGFQTFSFSFSGHGNMPFEASFGIDQFTLELEQFISTHNLEPAIIFGYSMGGFVALSLAKKQPSSIKKIVTLGTKFNWSKEVVEKETAMLNPEFLQQKAPAFASKLKQKHGGQWEVLLSSTAGMMRKLSQEKYLHEDDLININTEVLIGMGDRDKMVTHAESYLAYKNLPDAGMFMLPHTSHGFETVNTNLLSKIITEFINK